MLISFPFFTKWNDSICCIPVFEGKLWAGDSAGADWTPHTPMKGRKTTSQHSNLFVFVCLCHQLSASDLSTMWGADGSRKHSMLPFPLSDMCPPPHTHAHTHKSVSLYTVYLISPSLHLPSLSPETRSSLSTLLSLFKLWTSQQNKWCSSVASALCPLVLLLSNKPGWPFAVFNFLRMAVDVEKGKESERQRERENRQIKQALDSQPHTYTQTNKQA